MICECVCIMYMFAFGHKYQRFRNDCEKLGNNERIDQNAFSERYSANGLTVERERESSPPLIQLELTFVPGVTGSLKFWANSLPQLNYCSSRHVLEGASGTTYRQIGFPQFIVRWEIERVLVSRYDAIVTMLSRFCWGLDNFVWWVYHWRTSRKEMPLL